MSDQNETTEAEVMHEPLPVPGYTPETDATVNLVAINKQLEEGVLRVLDNLQNVEGIDQRWLATGRTDIEKGFSSVNRAIFNPGRISLPGDEIPADEPSIDDGDEETRV